MTGRYHIDTRPAPAAFVYPAKFRLGDGDDYVKYGHAPLSRAGVAATPTGRQR